MTMRSVRMDNGYNYRFFDHLADITEWMGGRLRGEGGGRRLKKGETGVLDDQLVGPVDAVIAGGAEGGFVGATDDCRHLPAADVAEELHLLLFSATACGAEALMGCGRMICPCLVGWRGIRSNSLHFKEQYTFNYNIYVQ